jgi:hypothetical protein
MTTWRNRIKSLPWRKVVSEKTQAKFVEIYLNCLKFIKPTVEKIQKTTIYKKIEAQLSKVSKRNKKIVIVVLVAIILLGGYSLISNHPDKSFSSQNATSTQKGGLIKGTPNFSVLSPNGKSINDLGGWIRSDKRPLFVYLDKVDGIQINVSQQPLPSDFKNDTANQVNQLAEAYNASAKITVGGVLVHIGTSKKGVQSVIFNKNNLLVLIVSNDQIKNDQWANYINSLQ